jgi:hypothetical protein
MLTNRIERPREKNLVSEYLGKPFNKACPELANEDHWSEVAREGQVPLALDQEELGYKQSWGLVWGDWVAWCLGQV